MRWFVRIIGFLVVVALLGAAGILFLPTDRIARIATDRFEAATGRQMTIGGPLRPTFWPALGVSTGAVTLANAGWSQEGPMLRAESVTIGVDVMALIAGDVRITEVAVVAPEVLLEVAADGRTNWDVSAAASAPAAPAGPAETAPDSTAAFSLDEARLEGARVTMLDHAAGRRTEVSEIDVTVRLPDYAGPAEIALSGRMNGQGFSATGQVAQFASFLSDGTSALTLSAEAAGAKLSFDGRAGLVPLAVGGALSADVPDLSPVFALLGQPAPELPAGLGRSLSVNGQVTYGDTGRLTLRETVLKAAGNTLSVNADVETSGARPKVTAQVAGGALDFSALVGGDTSGSDGGAGGDGSSGWSRDPIDVSALQALDLELALTADSLNLGLARLGRADLLVSLVEGRAVTQIRQLAAYDGSIAGSVVVNSRGGLSSRVDLSASDVAMQPLLTDLAGYDRLIGTGDVRLNVLAVGNSMHALMNSLGGEGALSFGKGEMRGLDIAGMIRNLDTSYVGEGQKTIFDGITASFTIADGVLRNDDLTFDASKLTATGKGRVGIGAQDMDYRLLPVLLEGENTAGIRVPLIIKGPWDDLSYKLDLEALVEQEWGDEIDAIKDDAEREVVDKLNKELGTSIESLDDVEDKLKEELGNRAGKALLDLLGGKN